MISRYQSDLSEWAAMAADGSNNDIVLLTGSGGFTSTHRPQVNQNEIPSNYWETGSNGGTLTFPDFEFINGGYVVIELTVNGNNRNINLTANGSANGITASSVGGGTAAGNNVALSSGTYTITYTLDASINGITSLALKPSNSNMYVTGITVCSNPGTNPVLTYTADPANPQPFTAVIGGNTDMKAIQVKGFNLQDIVNLEITGEKAGYFSVNLENINIASAEAGKNIWITYKSSAIPSVQEAVLRITSLNANVIEVPLKGISTPADVTKPVILADNSTIPFWTSLITNQTKTLSIAGINLIGDVTLRITGAGAGEFTVNKSTILQADALKGSSVDITYIADTKASTANAVLEISSRGADTVYVPLTGYTFLEKPELFELKFEVSPSGSASITADPAGTMYLKGTEVTAKVTPEPDWIIDYWSDAGGNRSAERKIIVSDLKNGTITVFMREDPGIVIIDPTSTFVAYPPENVSQTGFKGIWSSAENATNYVVNVYDKNKDLIHTALPAGMANELVVTGLTAGEYYYYEVVADVPATPDNNMTGKETTGMVGPFPTLPAPSTFVCGN
jgi:hypothetical protein